MNATEIYAAGNHILVKSGYGDPDMHRHSAAHILVSLGSRMNIVTEDAKIECKGAMIPSNAAHTVDNNDDQMLVFLFDETTVCSEQIKEIQVLSRESVCGIVNSFECMEKHREQTGAYTDFVGKVMEQTCLSGIGIKPMDERVADAVRFIDENAGEDLPLETVAKHCFLSESRFSHLFREQAGITFAGYLILRRLYLAYCGIAQGKSFTEAAIEAGFSDSAHFAAVNKKMFGLTATAISRGLKLYMV